MPLPSLRPCANCGTTNPEGQWWNLSNYYGIKGYFCPECYDKVSHDPYGNPERPDDYQAVLKKQKEPK